MKRFLYALIPVVLLATASLAFNEIYRDSHVPPPSPAPLAQTAEEEATPPPAPAPVHVAAPAPKVVAQAPPAQEPEGTEQVVQAAEEPQEPLPELIVDTTPLTQAQTALDKAIHQAKLSVTAVDATSQARYIQETINLLGGREDPHFRVTAQSNGDNYRGVSPLLVEARVKREAAEVQWIAAVQRQLDAHAKRVAELAQAGSAEGTVPTQPEQRMDLAAAVGPTGVLGTRGVRPEEQANELVMRALRQAVEALKMTRTSTQPSIQDQDVAQNYASDDATRMMESIVRTLETARKIVQLRLGQ